MKIDIENLPDSQELLQKIIVDLHRELDLSHSELFSYKEKYTRLIEEIRLAKQQRFSPSSEKNSLQPDIFDEAGVELPKEVLAQLDDETEVKGHLRKKHPVRRSLPKELPRETILHDIADEEKICTCGAQLIRIGEEVSEQLKYIPAQVSVVAHVRPKYACKPCQDNVKIAASLCCYCPKVSPHQN